MVIIIVFDKVWTRSSPVASQYFYCSLPRDQSRDVTLRFWIFVILQCTSFRLRIFFPSTIITTM